MGLGNVFFLGVECEHFWLYLAACCLASVVFTNLAYTLTVSFGNIGKALAIIGLVLQLAGAGGLMPVQMLSAPLFRRFTRGCPSPIPCRRWKEPWPASTATSTLCRWGLLAAILVPSLILGLVLRRPVIRLNDWVLAQAGRDEVFSSASPRTAPVTLKSPFIDQTSLAALSSNGQKIALTAFRRLFFSATSSALAVRYKRILTW